MYKLIELSKNAKTGYMPATYAGMDSCPLSCALYNECYAKGHTMFKHFKGANDSNIQFKDLITWVKNMPITYKINNMWRWGVSGDLPSIGKSKKYIDKVKLTQLAQANMNRNVLAFTHFRPFKHNIEAVQLAKDNGFHINFSCDTIKDIQTVLKAGLSAVTYTTASDTRKSWTDNGIRFVTCPNQSLKSKPTCGECRLCSKSRDYVIVFRPHGVKKNSIQSVV